MPNRLLTQLLLCLSLPMVSVSGSLTLDLAAERGRLDREVLSADDPTSVTAYLDDNVDNDNRLIQMTYASARRATCSSEATQAPESEPLTLFLYRDTRDHAFHGGSTGRASAEGIPGASQNFNHGRRNASLSAAVLLAVGQKSRPQLVAIVAGRLHRLLGVLALAIAGGEFDIFGSDISLIRGQRECQDDVVSFGATHLVVSLPPLATARGSSNLAANWRRRQVLKRPRALVLLG
jgi:hypothetical protein